MLKKLIGTKQFYKMVFMIAIPIIVQNGITNFVSLLDNIMVGRVGLEEMSGVAIVNQFIFVYNICLFGVISGAGIFGTQYFGKGDHDGVRHAFRFKVIACTAVALIGMAIFLLFPEPLINMYLHEGGEDVGDIAKVMEYAKNYLFIMIIGLLPYAFSQAYSSTLRETGQTFVPMMSGVLAVCVNLVFNYLLIYGKFGFPKLGVYGAAIATVMSRYVELIILVVWTHANAAKNIFIRGAYRSLRIPASLVKGILIKGTPLMVNEILWAVGMAMLNQRYSTKGIDVVSAVNIASVLNNLFNVVYISLGSAVSIVVGQLLGLGKMKEAKEQDAQLIAFSVFTCIIMGSALFLVAPFFPEIYESPDSVKHLATQLIRISACFMPVGAFVHAAYFTLRSGGKTFITFLFDSVFVWAVVIPLAFFLTECTTLPIIPIYFCCVAIDIVKCIIGFILVKKGIWLHNIT